MERPRPGEQPSPKGLLARLDRAAAKMNAFLLVLAIGLATLDFTCFWVLQVRAAMPAATSAAAAAPSSAHGKAHAAAASTSQPSAMAAGF